jgi:hypothetical protein
LQDPEAEAFTFVELSRPKIVKTVKQALQDSKQKLSAAEIQMFKSSYNYDYDTVVSGKQQDKKIDMMDTDNDFIYTAYDSNGSLARSGSLRINYNYFSSSLENNKNKMSRDISEMEVSMTIGIGSIDLNQSHAFVKSFDKSIFERLISINLDEHCV